LQRRDTHHAPCALDEAQEQLHLPGPERLGRLTNHAPMLVEAPAAHGRSDAGHRWLDLYERKLEEFPAAVAAIPVPDGRRRWVDPRRLTARRAASFCRCGRQRLK
jgi:hypothetical protein